MRLLFARLACLVVAGSSLCAIATCSRQVPPAQPPETRPAGPRPVATPNLPLHPGERPHWPLDARPASISPRKPPLDAGPDGGVPLPPLPDAGPVPGLRDAATPMY